MSQELEVVFSPANSFFTVWFHFTAAKDALAVLLVQIIWGSEKCI